MAYDASGECAAVWRRHTSAHPNDNQLDKLIELYDRLPIGTFEGVIQCVVEHWSTFVPMLHLYKTAEAAHRGIEPPDKRFFKWPSPGVIRFGWKAALWFYCEHRREKGLSHPEHLHPDDLDNPMPAFAGIDNAALEAEWEE